MRLYGQWAGNPMGQKEDATLCIVEVSSPDTFGMFHQCSRKRGHGTNGLYCKQHASKEPKVFVPADLPYRRVAKAGEKATG